MSCVPCLICSPRCNPCAADVPLCGISGLNTNTGHLDCYTNTAANHADAFCLGQSSNDCARLHTYEALQSQVLHRDGPRSSTPWRYHVCWLTKCTVLPASPAASCAYFAHMHRLIGVLRLPLSSEDFSRPPAILCVQMDAQAMLQMDAATKWGQEKSNSLVFNTFIFMQVIPCFGHPRALWCMHQAVHDSNMYRAFSSMQTLYGLHFYARQICHPQQQLSWCALRRSSTSSMRARSRTS